MLKMQTFHSQLGCLQEAEDALSEANILDNTDAEVWGYLSLVCLKVRQTLFKRYASLNPSATGRLIVRPANPQNLIMNFPSHTSRKYSSHFGQQAIIKHVTCQYLDTRSKSGINAQSF